MNGSIEIIEKIDSLASHWDGPLLVLTSVDDKLSCEQAELHKERYPQARIHTFQEGGHHTIFLFPEEYLRIVTEFLSGY